MTEKILDDVVTDEETRQYLRDPGLLMTIAGAIGLLAASILTIDKVALLQSKVDGTFKSLSCDVNPFISCSGVMESKEASAFGFPNSVLGVIGFAVVLTLGVLVLARVELPPFVWVGLQVGAVFGIGFVTWLQFQSIINLELLCPWCMVVWSMMIPLFVGITARNLRAFAPGTSVTRFVTDWKLLIVVLWFVALVAAIWFQFGSDLWA